MKRFFILIILVVVMGCYYVQAQRPVGDTTYMGGDADYLYDTVHIAGSYYPLGSMLANNVSLDIVLLYYFQDVLSNLFQPTEGEELQFYLEHPDLATYTTGRFISGQEFYLSDDVMVIGLAVCPTLVTDVSQLVMLPLANYLVDYDYRSYYNGGLPIADTSMANRETEYVQLYSMGGNMPHLRAEAGWRWEYPHRYCSFISYTYNDRVLPQFYDTIYVPMYEAMFDSGILMEGGKSFMVAGTHNNNGAVVRDTCYDIIFPQPAICWGHYPTTYSSSYYSTYDTVDFSFWIQYDTLPWWNYHYSRTHGGGVNGAINIIPILDTLFGTPCAEASNLQVVEVDTLWATVMWSADARHRNWQVEYCATGLPPDSARVVTVDVPTATLTGLEPGTEYSVVVRGRCDIDNYSPWSDTLLLTTPQDTTPDTVMPPPDTLGIRAMGNLDRFTRMMPNPAGEVVNVLSSYRLESVTVYDLTGRQVLEQRAEGISTVVNVSALPRGTYIVAICTQQGVATKKLVVE